MDTAGLVMVHGTELYGTLRSHTKLPDGLNTSLQIQQALYELANRRSVRNIRVLADGYDDELRLVRQNLPSTTIQKFSLVEVLWSVLQSSQPAWRVGRAKRSADGYFGLIWCGGDDAGITMKAFLSTTESYRNVDAVSCGLQQLPRYTKELASTLYMHQPREIVVCGPVSNNQTWRALTEEMANRHRVSVVYYKTPNLLKALLAL